ncbi:MAG: hypothetical protein AB7N71_10515 [Phycisphaerae bacterium]
MQRIRTFAFVVVLTLPAWAGCKSAESNLTYSSRVMASGSADRVFAAGRDVLLAEFARLESVDARARQAQTAPQAYRTRTESGTARDVRRGQSEMRRIASLLVNERDTEVVARVRVEIERQDVARTQQLQRSPVRISDYPGDETALDRDAATDNAQNSVWTFVRRDQEMENELLRKIALAFSSSDANATTVRQADSATSE